MSARYIITAAHVRARLLASACRRTKTLRARAKGPEYVEGEHPRDDHGRWSTAGAGGGRAEDLAQLYDRLTRPDAGFSYSITTRRQPKTGYAVSPYPEASESHDAAAIKPVDLAKYIAKNKDKLQSPGHYFGGWHDPASGRVFLDISVVTDSADEAATLCRKHDQIAYFDLAGGVSITINPDATSGGAAKKGISGGQRTKAEADHASGGLQPGRDPRHVPRPDRPRAYARGDRGGQGRARQEGREVKRLLAAAKAMPTGPLPFARDAHGRLLLVDAPDYRQQAPYDCGADCVRIVLALYGRDISEDEAIAALNTSEKDGTPPRAIIKFLSEQGLQVTARHGLTLAELAAMTAAGTPVICPIQAYANMQAEAWQQAGHYVVVLGMPDEDRITLQDPVAGRLVVPAGWFETHWIDNDGETEFVRYGIAVSGFAAGDRVKTLDLTPPPAPDASLLAAQVEAAAAETYVAPTAGQKKAGTYRKGRVVVHGLPITIETPRGAVRSGQAADGTPWHVTMAHHYGYIRQTESEADGDHVDIFIGPNLENDQVFVIDQRKADGSFDEAKCCIGFSSAGAAAEGYLACYSPGWTGFGGIRTLSLEEFKRWLKTGDTGAPIATQALKRLMAGASTARLVAKSLARARALLRRDLAA